MIGLTKCDLENQAIQAQQAAALDRIATALEVIALVMKEPKTEVTGSGEYVSITANGILKLMEQVQQPVADSLHEITKERDQYRAALNNIDYACGHSAENKYAAAEIGGTAHPETVDVVRRIVVETLADYDPVYEDALHVLTAIKR